VTINSRREKMPAILAALVDIRSNEFRGIQRTFLAPDGSGKADLPGGARRMLGPSANAVCKLSRDEDVTTVLGIGEGIESTLSMRSIPECHGIPVWACLSAPALAAFPVLPSVEVLWVAVDHDKAGIKAAAEVRARWSAAGREVFTIQAVAEEADLNDVVRRRSDG
jgi:hypothetical protein